MTRFAIALVLLTAPAHADTCEFGPNGTRVSIAPGDESFAVVSIYNALASQFRTTCDLTIYGVTVQVRYDAGRGREPDWFHVTVPPGFRAEPPSILLDDFTSGEVEIHIDEGENS
jgi:hypothetical protein